MTGPEHSTWLSKSTVSVAIPSNSVESERSSLSPSSTESLPDSTGLVLEAIKWAEKLSCRSDCESTLFSSLMNEIISLPVTTVMHVPRSVRPELAEVFAAELNMHLWMVSGDSLDSFSFKKQFSDVLLGEARRSKLLSRLFCCHVFEGGRKAIWYLFGNRRD